MLLPFLRERREVVLTTMNRQGAQGILDGASKAMLENEFGTHRDEDVVQQILEKGEIQEATVRHFPFRPLPLLSILRIMLTLASIEPRTPG